MAAVTQSNSLPPQNLKRKVAELPVADQRFEFRATQKAPEVVLNIREGSAIANMDMADFAREAVMAAYERVKAGQPIRGAIDLANVGTNSFRAPLLSRVPCGPLKEAVNNGDAFTISAETADELESRDGDFWVRAEGESMLESGIQDSFLVLMRPLDGRPPKRGEIALLQFFDGEGAVYEATIKHWNGEGKYADSKGTAFVGPKGYECKAVAVARGVLGRF